MARGSRPANEDDVENVKAWALLKLCGQTNEGRQAFRELPPAVQEEIHVRAAAERERQANGPTLTWISAGRRPSPGQHGGAPPPPEWRHPV